MRKGPDLSKFLFHWTKPSLKLTAFDVLIKILSEKKINATCSLRKGLIESVCFTETPWQLMRVTFLDQHDTIKYKPYGIGFSKELIYDLGGRPVIYQPESDFELLPDELKFKHVSYNPKGKPDFTWEREWRMPTDLEFSFEDCWVCVGDETHLLTIQESFPDLKTRVKNILAE